MEKLTLNETWELCLSMWKWIAKQKRARRKEGVGWLKLEWMENNYPQTDIQNSCFFCDWAYRYPDTIEEGHCPKCPGALVEKQFRCENTNYDYESHPIAFYNKLVSLNRKRQKKKAKSKK